MSNQSKKFKSGATSIYVVVVSALLLSVITLSFIRIIINESSRTASDELSQAAYDSALAGVEDAKVALKKYFECINREKSGATDPEGDCEHLKDTIGKSMEDGSEEGGGDKPDCDRVAKALGRIADNEGKEVLVQESTSGNDEKTVQAYTCVLLNPITSDYRSTLSSETPVRVIPLKPADVGAEQITGVKISWFSEDDGTDYNNKNKNSFTPFSDGAPTPSTISAQIIQTAASYSLSDFETTDNDSTNRGTVFLTADTSSGSSNNHVDRDIIINSNKHDVLSVPSVTKCQNLKTSSGGENDEFSCTTTIEIPAPVNANISGNKGVTSRNPDTFYLALSLPYGQPSTSFSIQLCTDGGSKGNRGRCNTTANFDKVQVAVDSTGRANDMYSRVEARVEFADIHSPYPEFALLATGSDADAINKNFYVTKNCWTVNDGSIETCDNTGEP